MSFFNNPGVQYSGSYVNPATNILSVTSTLQRLGGRTHIFYQDSGNNIRRLDVSGLGAKAYVTADEFVDRGTPGTRLTTTNSTSTYCGRGGGVTIYYQINTAEIMYYTFTDYYSTGGLTSSSSTGYSISSKVKTYDGQKKDTKKHFTPAQRFGIAVGAFFALVFVIGCFIAD